MGVHGDRHNYKGFCEKFTLLKSINRGRMTISRVPYEAKKNYSFVK